MIITKLIGGLGNQMFQYAAGRRAALFNNVDLKLDITGYENQDGITPRKYMLHIFNIKEDFVNLKEIQRLKGARGNIFIRSFSRLKNKITPYYKQPYVRQKSFQFDPNILEISDETYLDGYWVSEKYFKDIQNTIHKEFAFREKPDKKNKRIIDHLKKLESVSIHIRRGDYVSDKKTHDYHGICGMDYYKKAVQIVAQKIRKPYFFIFSDDPEWAKKNIKIKHPNKIVDYNFGKKDHEDLRLMSLCNHNIIANSSFSWWGAWLNKNPNKIVIAPKRWFADQSIDTTDLVPDSWIRT